MAITIGIDAVFNDVGNLVAVEITQQIVVGAQVWIRFSCIDATVVINIFNAIFHATAIGVWIYRAGAGRRIGIRHEHAFGCIRPRARRNDAGFRTIEDAVVVAIWIEHVIGAIAIGVIAWIGFTTIGNAIVVGIRIIWIRSQHRFLRVA